MKIEYIKLENFRQFKDVKIDFSTDNEKNVTMIMGNNGSGKTTLAQAFTWCLYGETNFLIKDLLNKEKERELDNYLSTYIKVKIGLEHSDKKYVIERKQAWQKRGTRIAKDNPEVSVLITKLNGETKVISDSVSCEREINKILPKELSKYFFFDGERIEKMSKEVQGGKRSSEFGNAVRGLLGLNTITSAIDHLSDGKRSVIGEYDQLFTQANDKELQLYSKGLIKAKEERVKKERELKYKDLEKEREKELYKEYNEKLKEFEESKKYQEIKETYIKEKEKAEKRKNDRIKSLLKDFDKYYYSFFSQYLLTDAIKNLEEFKFKEEEILIPGINIRLLNYLLNEKKCICGRDINDSSEEYKKLVELKKSLEKTSNYTIKNSISSFISSNKTNFTSVLYDNLIEKSKEINKEQGEIEIREENIKEINKKLSGKDVENIINELNRNLLDSERRISALEDEKIRISREIGEIEKSIKNLEKRIAKLTDINNENRKIQIYRNYTIEVCNELDKIKRFNEMDSKKSLENKINRIFNTFFETDLCLELDENYSIRIHAENYQKETSTAQSGSVIFSFIAGIIELMRENQNNKLASEPYPLVMDAPLSIFDKERIGKAGEILPSIAEQVIIFIKDTEGDLLKENISNKIGKINTIKKISNNNSIVE